ncbi:hypothetical protein MKZ38_006101 [Zalerion maritima]|uniref:Uncharacterized protein n=1 Tax=Zalerion maritima TaxID=339359 RepID=A0AAD5RXC1_9PEZI|nr:hypothetical protein MKZ38_006101 [Zalerion maritima]
MTQFDGTAVLQRRLPDPDADPKATGSEFLAVVAFRNRWYELAAPSLIMSLSRTQEEMFVFLGNTLRSRACQEAAVWYPDPDDAVRSGPTSDKT